jgi:hypothetical protein
MFRAGVEHNQKFTVEDYIFAYKAELMRDKIKRRTISFGYAMVQSKTKFNQFLSLLYYCFDKANLKGIAKRHRLSVRETEKLKNDVKKLDECY